jgi:hypothetical protein
MCLSTRKAGSCNEDFACSKFRTACISSAFGDENAKSKSSCDRFSGTEAAIRLFERTVAKKNIALLAAHFAFDGHLRVFRE